VFVNCLLPFPSCGVEPERLRCRFDALLRCYSKLLLLLHQVSCCHLAPASVSLCTRAIAAHVHFKNKLLLSVARTREQQCNLLP
jgi:hypothetical protein